VNAWFEVPEYRTAWRWTSVVWSQQDWLALVFLQPLISAHCVLP